MSDTVSDTSPDTAEAGAAMSQLGDSLAQAATSQRQLFQDIANFARSESLRFANLRLERNGAALEKMQSCQGLPGLIGVQQEWLRSFVEDYFGQQVRLAGAFRGLSQEAMTNAAETASETIDRVREESREIADTVSEELDQMADTAVRQTEQIADTADRQVDQIAQDANRYSPVTQH